MRARIWHVREGKILQGRGKQEGGRGRRRGYRRQGFKTVRKRNEGEPTARNSPV
jgi:hypothetical protein